jgi:hypothetical protein
MAGDLAGAINALTSTGLAAYEVSTGAPVSVSSTAGIPSYSVGSVFSGTSGAFVIIAIAAVAIVFFWKK